MCLCACVYSSSPLSFFGQYPLGGVRHIALKSGEVGGGEGKGGAEERRNRKRENSILKLQWASEMYFTLYWLFLFVNCCYLFCQAAYVWNWSKSHSLKLHQCYWIELREENKVRSFPVMNKWPCCFATQALLSTYLHVCCSGCHSSFFLISSENIWIHSLVIQVDKRQWILFLLHNSCYIFFPHWVNYTSQSIQIPASSDPYTALGVVFI